MQEGHPRVTEPPPKAETPKPKATPLKRLAEKVIKPLQDIKRTVHEEIGIQQALAVIKYGGLTQAKAAEPELFGLQSSNRTK